MKKSYLWVIPVIIGINFFLPRLMPGDPFLYLSVEDGNVATQFSQVQIDQYKDYYGLNQPLVSQFSNYLVRLLHCDLGVSIYYNTSVTAMIGTRLPWTILIVVSALIISSFVGTVLGTISAWHREKRFDRIAYPMMLFISEVPAFLVGIVLLFLMAAELKWFPLSGGSTVFANYDTAGERFYDIITHMILPVLTLVLIRMGGFYLLSRNSMLTVLSKDYIRTARGKGLSERKIVFKHALANSFLPVVMQILMSFGALFGQAVLVENVFAYPGVGSLMREAVLNRDYALMQGIFLIMALLILITNFIAELAFKKLDPRVAR